MDVYARAAQWRGGASFPGFINLLFEATIKDFSDAEKQMAYGKVPQFAPLTEAELAAAARVGGPRPAGGSEPGHRAQPGHPRHQPRGDVRRADLHAAPDAAPSRPGAGRTTSKACAQCHRFGAIGTDFGPDLTTLASRFKKRDVVEAILWPSRAVSDQYQSVEVHDHRQADAVRPRRARGRRQDRAADDAGRAADSKSRRPRWRRGSHRRCR